MNILYVAKHNSGGNDDEGAITYALQRLGHSVATINEATVEINQLCRFAEGFDFALFHHWDKIELAARLPCKKVFWYFDRIELADGNGARERTKYRTDWVYRATEACDYGFLTDGDWVAKYGNGKLYHLLQGADERVIGFGSKIIGFHPLILFAGSVGYDNARKKQIESLQARYGKRFYSLEGKRRVYRREFANVIASSDFVLAPISPCTERYFSNRIFVVCGFGGLLLHPTSELAASCYSDGKEVAFYGDNLFDRIDALINLAKEERVAMRVNAIERTMKEHLYRHRVSCLLSIINGESI